MRQLATPGYAAEFICCRCNKVLRVDSGMALVSRYADFGQAFVVSDVGISTNIPRQNNHPILKKYGAGLPHVDHPALPPHVSAMIPLLLNEGGCQVAKSWPQILLLESGMMLPLLDKISAMQVLYLLFTQ